jgi:protein TonB
VPGTPVAPAAGEKYLPASELDLRPEPLSEIDPEYPADGPPGGGQLVVRILINERGGADDVQVLAAEPRGAFERAVVDAFSAGRYRPGEKNGRPVKSQMTIAVTFHPENPAHMPAQPALLPQPAPAPAEPR